MFNYSIGVKNYEACFEYAKVAFCTINFSFLKFFGCKRSGKWKLVESPVDYIHSSAKYYIVGEQGIYGATNFMELEDIDLSKKIYW